MSDLTAFLVSALAGALGTLLVGRLILRYLPTRYRSPESPGDDRIQVLVLGDVGRSPRMQYHALSITGHGCNVDLIGYKETARHPGLVGNPKLTFHPLGNTPEWLQWQHSLFVGLPLKALWQSLVLFQTLMYSTPPARWIVIQNPPSIPTLHVALLASWFRGSKLLLDWHNYGYTLMGVNRSRWNPFPGMYKKYECFFGRHVPNVNITVTEAMGRQLRTKPFNVKKPILTLHDRPAAHFVPITSREDRKEFLAGLRETKDFADSILAGKTRLLVSSTSWTPDEDFAIFLEALVEYVKTPSGIPCPILAIVTGKGPQKADFEKFVAQLMGSGNLENVTIRTAWLSTKDYASLLACADLGICLHKSSSGVDLPMKVVDMFGAGLPVAAYSGYESFGELVRDGENGCGFETSSELAEILVRLLGKKGQRELASLREGAMKEGRRRWEDEWDNVVGAVLGLTN